MSRICQHQTWILWAKRAHQTVFSLACRQIDRELGPWGFCKRSSALWTVSLHQVLALLAKELVLNSCVVPFKNSHFINFPSSTFRVWLLCTLLCLAPLEYNAACLERLLCISRLAGSIHGIALGCPESLWDLHPWEYSKAIWTWSWAPCTSWPFLRQKVRQDDFLKSLSSSVILWFLHSYSLHCPKNSWIWPRDWEEWYVLHSPVHEVRKVLLVLQKQKCGNSWKRTSDSKVGEINHSCLYQKRMNLLLSPGILMTAFSPLGSCSLVTSLGFQALWSPLDILLLGFQLASRWVFALCECWGTKSSADFVLKHHNHVPTVPHSSLEELAGTGNKRFSLGVMCLTPKWQRSGIFEKDFSVSLSTSINTQYWSLPLPLLFLLSVTSLNPFPLKQVSCKGKISVLQFKVTQLPLSQTQWCHILWGKRRKHLLKILRRGEIVSKAFKSICMMPLFFIHPSPSACHPLPGHGKMVGWSCSSEDRPKARAVPWPDQKTIHLLWHPRMMEQPRWGASLYFFLGWPDQVLQWTCFQWSSE